MRSKYFGKRPTSTFSYVPPSAPTPGPDPRWVFHGKMSMRTALRIFGLDTRPNAATLQARYRTLIWEHHPDHGGSTEIAAAINAAYSYLR